MSSRAQRASTASAVSYFRRRPCDHRAGPRILLEASSSDWRFFVEHGDTGPDGLPLHVRLERYRQMRASLGRLTTRRVRQSPDGEGLVVVAASESGEALTMTFLLSPEPPHRPRRIRVEAGGS